MIIAWLLLTPLIAALGCALCRNDKAGKFWLIAGALGHIALCVMLISFPEGVHLNDSPVSFPGELHLSDKLVLKADLDGFLILSVTSLIFLLCSVYMCFWLPLDAAYSDCRKGMKPYALISCLFLFLFTMTLTALAQDFGMLWVAVEATTLASAPLINYHRNKGSLEAMWKYLLICSIGIGLALFGTMLLAAAVNDPHCGLGFTELKQALAENGNLIWIKIGFVFCFAGYALKMGLAPFHTWMPDAYSESPSPVSALISGSLVNYALLAIIRLLNAMPENLQDFACGYLKFFGFFSLAVAAFFILRQKDFKRMLAYSSVEHMGLIALLYAYGQEKWATIHILCHSLLKMMMFLIAGNIVLAYRTRLVADVRGLFRRIPGSAALWILGILLICGTPPSPLFLTELNLVKAAGIVPGSVILLLLLVIFAGMSRTALNMAAPEASMRDCGVDKKADELAFVPGFSATLIVLAGLALSAALMIGGVNIK